MLQLEARVTMGQSPWGKESSRGQKSETVNTARYQRQSASPYATWGVVGWVLVF